MEEEAERGRETSNCQDDTRSMGEENKGGGSELKEGGVGGGG